MALNNNFGLFGAHPPRLEDAGLEDAALPANSIQEAFKRAADALQTTPWRLHSSPVNDLGGVRTEEKEDAKSPALGKREICVDLKTGGLPEEGHDLVVGPDFGQYVSDKVEFGKEKGVPKLGDKGCVEGLPGDRGEDKDTIDESEDGPILVLA